jgi:hypothetical protein
MKRQIGPALLAASVAFTGVAAADSLAVNAGAALGGSFGLELLHDNTSQGYVEDQSPASEVIYRFEFLYDPNDLGQSADTSPASGFRHTLFGAYGANPRPNAPGNACPLNPNIPVFPLRIFAIWGGPFAGPGPGPSIPGVRMTIMSNQCGVAGSPGIFWADGGPRKLCGYVEMATVAGASGEGGLAVVPVGDACPAVGNVAYGVANTPNIEHAVTFVRLGNLAINPFAAGEDGSVYLDEFASFRTLAP